MEGPGLMPSTTKKETGEKERKERYGGGGEEGRQIDRGRLIHLLRKPIPYVGKTSLEVFYSFFHKTALQIFEISYHA